MAPHPPSPRVSVYLAVSLDGFIARSDGSLDWLEPMQLEGEDYGYGEFIASVDTVVMGRGTYDVTVGFDPWPHEGRRTVVLTTRPLEPRGGAAVESYAGDVALLAARLAAEGARHLYVDGGATIRAFLSARLVSELTLSVVPVLLGEGLMLFGPAVPGQALTLQSARSYASGLTQLSYRLG